MKDCIFCKIARGEIPASLVYESDQVVAFNDIDPKAPVHVLIIPRHHYPTLIDIADLAPELAGELFKAVSMIARDTGIAEDGFRLMVNTNDWGGQEVFHMHMHLLGGEPIGPMRCRH